MCGFLVINKNKINIQSFSLFLDKISHRGPDDKRFLFSNSINLSFYRLSIIDQSSKANQPMRSKNNNNIMKKA